MATSKEGFVQILASNYLPHGYWFYSRGRIPDGKDGGLIDEKIIAKYGIDLSRQQRLRKKQQGIANLHYVRFENEFVILATHGKHRFFTEEGTNIRDIRRVPLQFKGYSMTVRRGQYLKKEEGEDHAMVDGRFRVRVMIGREALKSIRAELLELAHDRNVERLRWAFWNLPFEPYAPIRKQLLKALHSVNAVRSASNLEKVLPDCIRYRRRIVKPFEWNDQRVALVANNE